MGPRVLLHTEEGWLEGGEPLLEIGARDPVHVVEALERVERAVTKGYTAVGFVAYEAAGGLWDRFVTHEPAPGLPLVWFALYDTLSPSLGPPPVNHGAPPIDGWEPSLDLESYRERIAAIRELIAAGETYQVNFTLRLRAPWEAQDPLQLFARLCEAQPSRYAAFLDTGRFALCSGSPELFYRREGTSILCNPMKGTAPRGRYGAEGARNAEWLRTDEKNRAELVMIVDMVRNDLGRIAEVGTVRATGESVIEALPTVLQATSLVSARSGAGLVGTMRALFPAASITGAPKVRTMEIIRDLEDSPRGVYCGAIGALFPDGRSQFNVSIRTLVIDRDAGQAEYGVGSGIVWDSEADDEYRECLLKARVLEHRPEPFEIVESLLWTPDAGYALLERHQERLQATCAYFGFPVVSLHRVLPTGWPEAPGPLKVPMLVDRHGRVRIEHGPAPVWPEGMRVAFAREPVDPSDPFLFHKTTRRHQHEKARAGRPGYDEVLLWNPDRELTEATTANVVALFNGKEYTPPVECGLLAGTLRSDLLARGELTERAITLEELRGAEAIYLINSVRGRVQVEIDWSTFPAS